MVFRPGMFRPMAGRILHDEEGGGGSDDIDPGTPDIPEGGPPDPGDEKPTVDPEKEAAKLLAAERKQRKQQEAELRELREFRTKAEREKLSTDEQKKAELEDLQKRYEEADRLAMSRWARLAGMAAEAKLAELGLQGAAVLVRALDRECLELDDEGNLSAAAIAAIKAFAKAHPEFVGKPAGDDAKDEGLPAGQRRPGEEPPKDTYWSRLAKATRRA